VTARPSFPSGSTWLDKEQLDWTSFVVPDLIALMEEGESAMTAEDTMISRLALSDELLASKANEFAGASVVRVTELFTTTVFDDLEREAERLVASHGVRREFRMRPTGGTPRRMTNVAQAAIEASSPLVQRLYDNLLLRDVLASIARAPVFDCPYRPERYVITKLHQVGDTHGWHWDDYSLALVWILKAPPVEAGGIVQCLPGTRWDKRDPKIISQFVDHPIRSYHFVSGEAYLMNARTTLHRVYPLVCEGAERLILNCAFALTEDISDDVSHETVEQLWSAASH
jgi:hypothetical protein